MSGRYRVVLQDVEAPDNEDKRISREADTIDELWLLVQPLVKHDSVIKVTYTDDDGDELVIFDFEFTEEDEKHGFTDALAQTPERYLLVHARDSSWLQSSHEVSTPHLESGVSRKVRLRAAKEIKTDDDEEILSASSVQELWNSLIVKRNSNELCWFNNLQCLFVNSCSSLSDVLERDPFPVIYGLDSMPVVSVLFTVDRKKFYPASLPPGDICCVSVLYNIAKTSVSVPELGVELFLVEDHETLTFLGSDVYLSRVLKEKSPLTILVQYILLVQFEEITVDDWETISRLELSVSVHSSTPGMIAFTSPDMKNLLCLKTNLNARSQQLSSEFPVIAEEEKKEVAYFSELKDRNSTILCEKRFGNAVVQIVKGDIINETTDAIVNAANGNMDHRGGVALAISNAAGSELSRECYEYLQTRNMGRPLNTGECMISGAGGSLRCKKVIHAVGPIYDIDKKREVQQQLKKVIRNVLRTAQESNIGSVSMPLISSGIFGYPLEECVSLTLAEIKIFFTKNPKTGLRILRIIDKESGGKLDALCDELQRL
eukprot:TRINITY_DN31066_c0_g2_i1.p1 TRINITY_DN31066_c0_g2~~TRINITY_DN31066_c0_g2_i1.p1  ORF type:complete len:562 (-),score=106.54 TRINITY_DN31066_c0_g2_i1:54-1685(-)